MRFAVGVFLLPFTLAGLAQNHFIDEDESILFAEVQLEKDPSQQVRFLMEWEARYPQTYFAANRCERFSDAYQRLEEHREAFHYAVVCAALASAGPEELDKVVLLARRLQSPTPDELDATLHASRLLLGTVHGPPPSTAPNPDERRVENMLRDLRAQDALRMRRDAREAMAWVARHRQP
jgi:hypothetical protein